MLYFHGYYNLLIFMSLQNLQRKIKNGKKVVISILISLLLCFCHNAPRTSSISLQEKTTIPVIPEIQTITPENLEMAMRRLQDMDAGGTDYKNLRDKILSIIESKHKSAVETKKTEEGWDFFRNALKLFTPEEILAGETGEHIDSMAKWAYEYYSPLGDEARSMISLIILIGKHPENQDYRNKYTTLINWITEARKSFDDDVERIANTIEIYKQVASVVPVPAVTTKLLELYDERYKYFSKMLDGGGMQGLFFSDAYMKYYFANYSLDKTTYDIVWVYTKMGVPQESFDTITKYKGKRGYDPEIAKIINEFIQNPSEANNWLKLSQIFSDVDTDEALECCRRGWKIAPQDYRFALCIAELYQKQQIFEGAEEYLNIARVINPGEPEIYVKLMKLLWDWSGQTIKDEKMGEAINVLDKLEKVLKGFESRWPERKTPIVWNELIKRRGEVEYYTGKIEEATEHLRIAGENSEDTESLFLLGKILTFKKQLDEANSVYERISKVHRDSKIETRYLKIQALQKIGDIERLKGHKKEATNYYSKALEILESLLPYISLDYLGELYSMEGELNFRLGNKESALESFRTAVSFSDKVNIYGKILSFLMGAMDIQSMAEIYHLAYTDSEIPRKWKGYFSLWYIGLQKMLKMENDPIPYQVFSLTKENDWVDKLGDYYRGIISLEELNKSALDTEKKVEMKFYRAMLAAGEGKKDEFYKLLRETIDSGYYAFYETEIAFEILSENNQLK